mmetsp:Transcript_18760/g.50351  ORF Transcript_18760/g.50351 Transcript_18760/m.50351 type:complete len:294 (-) Transcript_18760:506-1387(-)
MHPLRIGSQGTEAVATGTVVSRRHVIRVTVPRRRREVASLHETVPVNSAEASHRDRSTILCREGTHSFEGATGREPLRLTGKTSRFRAHAVASVLRAGGNGILDVRRAQRHAHRHAIAQNDAETLALLPCAVVDEGYERTLQLNKPDVTCIGILANDQVMLIEALHLGLLDAGLGRRVAAKSGDAHCVVNLSLGGVSCDALGHVAAVVACPGATVEAPITRRRLVCLSLSEGDQHSNGTPLVDALTLGVEAREHCDVERVASASLAVCGLPRSSALKVGGIVNDHMIVVAALH